MLLEDIIGEIEKLCVIYYIRFCRAGVGFLVYRGNSERLCSRYCPNIREAAEATLSMLKEKELDAN